MYTFMNYKLISFFSEDNSKRQKIEKPCVERDHPIKWQIQSWGRQEMPKLFIPIKAMSEVIISSHHMTGNTPGINISIPLIVH